MLIGADAAAARGPLRRSRDDADARFGWRRCQDRASGRHHRLDVRRSHRPVDTARFAPAIAANATRAPPTSPPRSTARTSGSRSRPPGWRSNWASTSTRPTKTAIPPLHLARQPFARYRASLCWSSTARGSTPRTSAARPPLAITTVAAIRGFYAMDPAAAQGDRRTAAEARRHRIARSSLGASNPWRCH